MYFIITYVVIVFYGCFKRDSAVCDGMITYLMMKNFKLDSGQEEVIKLHLLCILFSKVPHINIFRSVKGLLQSF